MTYTLSLQAAPLRALSMQMRSVEQPNAPALERQERFMQLLQPVQANVERFVRALVWRGNTNNIENEEFARDLLSETLLVAFEQFHTLRAPEAFLSFLFTIATRLHRKQREHWRRFEPFDAQKDLHSRFHQVSRPHTAAHDGTTAYTAADIATLYAALDKLPDKQREAVVMFEILGFSMKEIQAVQGGTMISVKVRISRGRALLAAMLTDNR
jgi:RNA polymerase sigma-70 factor (ECF subfamily)